MKYLIIVHFVFILSVDLSALQTTFVWWLNSDLPPHPSNHPPCRNAPGENEEKLGRGNTSTDGQKRKKKRLKKNTKQRGMSVHFFLCVCVWWEGQQQRGSPVGKISAALWSARKSPVSVHKEGEKDKITRPATERGGRGQAVYWNAYFTWTWSPPQRLYFFFFF